MKVVLIQNIVHNGARIAAGEIVDLEDKVAKEFLKNDLAAPHAEIEAGEVVVDADPEVLAEAEVDEADAPEVIEQEEVSKKATAKKSGGKAKK